MDIPIYTEIFAAMNAFIPSAIFQDQYLKASMNTPFFFATTLSYTMIKIRVICKIHKVYVTYHRMLHCKQSSTCDIRVDIRIINKFFHARDLAIAGLSK